MQDTEMREKGEGDSVLIEKKKDNKLSSGDIWLWGPGGIAVVLTN